MNAMTCASPSLPFNTQLALAYGGREVWVRVNDRGPFKTDSTGHAIFPLQPHPVRRLDLSRAAFQALTGDTLLGVAPVYVLIVEEANANTTD